MHHRNEEVLPSSVQERYIFDSWGPGIVMRGLLIQVASDLELEIHKIRLWNSPLR